MILSKDDNKSAQKSDSVKTAKFTPEKIARINWDKPLENTTFNYFDQDSKQKEPKAKQNTLSEFIDDETLEIFAPYMKPKNYMESNGGQKKYTISQL